MAWVPAAIAAGGEILSSVMGSSSAHKANRTNIKLSREQRAWEEKMANSAVQRRKADIEKAGFNPVLAAAGPGASTPSVSAPTVEPTFDANWNKDTARNAVLLHAQLQNLQANTASQQAEARSKTVDAEIKEDLAGLEKNFRANRYTEQIDWDDLKTKMMRIQVASGAAEQQRLEGTVQAMIQMAKQQQEAGKIDLDALRNIASMGGVEAGKISGLVKLILDAWRTSQNKRF